MSFLIKKIITVFIVPPFCFVWLALAGMLLSRKNKCFWRSISILSLVFVLLCCTPFVSSRLAVWIQDCSVVTSIDPSVQAIVILGGGHEVFAAEYQAPAPNAETLQRVRFGAFLAKKTGLPILVSSGDPFHSGVTEAAVMQQVLLSDWGIKARWREDQSNDTAENAAMTAVMLAQERISKIYLVTHAWHMPRAKFLFEQNGIKVVPAPTGIASPTDFSLHNFLLSGESFKLSSFVFKEIIGTLWARLN